MSTNLTKHHLTTAAMSRVITLAGILLAALAVQAQQATLTSPKDHAAGSGDAASCLKEAAELNSATIQFAQLAARKAQSPELRRFSQTLENDHKKAQEKLERIAQKHDVKLPTTLSPECQEKMTKLQSLSGEEFDKEFAKGAIQGHAMGIAKFRKAAEESKDQEVKEYATEMLTHMKEHQEKARQVAKAVGLDQTTIASLERQAMDGVGTPGASSESARGSSTKDNSDEQDPQEQPRDP